MMIYSLDQYFKQAKCIYTRRKIQVSENTSFIHLFSSSIEEKNNTEMNLMKMYSYGDKSIFYKNKTQNHARFWVGLGIQVAKTACKTCCSSSANVTLFCRGRGKSTRNSLAIWPLSSKIIRSASCTASLTSC